MNNYRRHHYNEVMKRLEEPRRFIQVLVGPRQVGKSTLMNQVLANVRIPYVLENADTVPVSDSDWIRRVWVSARTKMNMEKHSEMLLVIDEIQKLENWSEYVKREWDSDTFADVNLKVVLLGSSRLLLRKGLTESLAGRFELIRMNHWSLKEMQEAFGWTLDQYIYFGGYPGTVPYIDRESRWSQYVKDALVAPAIEKDAVLTSNIYKPALMKQLFEIGCSYSAELLSLTKVLGQLQDAGNITTLASYLEILNQCALLTGLQKYAADHARKYNSVPKYQVYNNALLTAYRGRGYAKDRIDPRVWGRWVESAVGAHLMAQADELGFRVFYWRERSDEVDFIVQKLDQTIAIEVKSGRRGMNKGLSLFRDRFHSDQTIIVGSGGISVEDFLTYSLEPLF